MRSTCQSALRRLLVPAAVGTVAVGTLLSPIAATAADPVQGERVPGSECTAAARPFSFFGTLVSTPPSSDPHVAPASAPLGAPADPATAEAVTAAVRQVLACTNAGEVLRAFSLFDDAYLRRIIDPSGKLTPEIANAFAASLATPTAVDEGQDVRLVKIHSITVGTDGRVAVVVESDGGVNDRKGTETDLFLFKKIGNVWLIDDAVRNIDQLTPTPNP